MPTSKKLAKKSSKKATKKAVKKQATKREAAPSKRVVASTKATKKVAIQVAKPTTITCFKVVVERKVGAVKKLQSIMTKGALRLTYSKKKVTNAPHASLPITAFYHKGNAERFIRRNAQSRSRRGLNNPWVLVQGEGVQVFPVNFNSRVPKIGEVKVGSRLTARVVKQVLDITSTQPPARRQQRGSNWRREYVGRNWSQGTIFLSSFRITS